MSGKRPIDPNSERPGCEDDLPAVGALSGKLMRAREGKNPGFKPPYGYGSDPESGAFVVDPAEAGVVRRIYALHRQGCGVINIARRLNEEGSCFRRGRRWGQGTVRKILENPIYRGELQYGRSSRNPSHGRREGEPFYLHHEPKVVLQDALPAIVSREEWAVAQLIRASRPGAARGTSGRAFSSSHLLSGIACCRCGQSIVGHRGRGDGCVYYCCSGRRKKGKRGCNCGYLQQGVVDRIVLARFREEFLRGLETRQQRVEADREAAANRAREAREGVAAAAACRARQGQQRADSDREGRRAGEPVEALERELREAEAEMGLWAYEAEMVEQARDIQGVPVERQKQLLRHFVRSVRLFREEGSQQVICDLRLKEPGTGLGRPGMQAPASG